MVGALHQRDLCFGFPFVSASPVRSRSVSMVHTQPSMVDTRQIIAEFQQSTSSETGFSCVVRVPEATRTFVFDCISLDATIILMANGTSQYIAQNIAQTHHVHCAK